MFSLALEFGCSSGSGWLYGVRAGVLFGFGGEC